MNNVLDIIFEGRNKEYGAYDLRINYNKRMLIASGLTFSFIAIFFISSLLANSEQNKVAKIIVQDVELESLKQPDEKKLESPPPLPPKQESPKVEMKQFTPPKIVKAEEVKAEEIPSEVIELEEVAIGTKNQEGIKDVGVVVPVVEAVGTGKVEAPKEEEDYNKIFTVVQIEAEFPGGKAAWNKYLQRNLNASLPMDNGALPGKYTVVVTFTVDKEGNVSDVQAENDPGYGTKEEAMKVIRKGPKWNPAVQNGRNVAYRHKQSITFIVSEEQ